MPITDTYPWLEPQAQAAVDAVADGNADMLLMTVASFTTDRAALSLRDLLRYALDRGVEVRFVPRGK